MIKLTIDKGTMQVITKKASMTKYIKYIKPINGMYVCSRACVCVCVCVCEDNKQKVLPA